MAEILTVSRRSHHLIKTLYSVPRVHRFLTRKQKRTAGAHHHC